jgi:hypothetical protein
MDGEGYFIRRAKASHDRWRQRSLMPSHGKLSLLDGTTSAQ